MSFGLRFKRNLLDLPSEVVARAHRLTYCDCEFTGRYKFDHAAPHTRQSGSTIKGGRTSKVYRGSTRCPRVSWDWNAWNRGEYPQRGGRRSGNRRIRNRHTHSERHNIDHWNLVHDVRAGLLLGKCPVCRQYYKGTGRHTETALHRRSHADLSCHVEGLGRTSAYPHCTEA